MQLLLALPQKPLQITKTLLLACPGFRTPCDLFTGAQGPHSAALDQQNGIPTFPLPHHTFRDNTPSVMGQKGTEHILRALRLEDQTFSILSPTRPVKNARNGFAAHTGYRNGITFLRGDVLQAITEPELQPIVEMILRRSAAGMVPVSYTHLTLPTILRV